MRRNRLPPPPGPRLASCLLWLSLPCLQESRPGEEITEERVREIVAFLADDALLGRDTPSPGLEAAAQYLAAGFAKAGLEPGAGDGTFFHTYTASGLALEPDGIEMEVHGPEGGRRLEPGADVRPWRASRAFEQEAGEVLRMEADKAAEGGLDRRLRGTKPVLLEVGTDSALWKVAGSTRRMLGGRRGGDGPPWVLVRKGALPPGDLSVSLRVKAPEAVEITLKNVIGILPGAGRREEFVVFSSHYDHIGVTLPVRGDAICNGADDDATGTTAVLALAESFAAATRRPPRSLAFVCFSGEEKGLMGSRAFCADPPFPLARVAANLNLEMLGRPPAGKERKAWITGHDLSDFAAIAGPAMAAAGVECIEFPMQGPLFQASDNASFARKGVVAHSISAGELHRDYHRPSDETGLLDISHMTAVIRAIRAAGMEFASREAFPAFNEKGARALPGR